ncbi:MAG: response regulator [Chloroflexi bacterium]|nr:response regulator [Chloroflexota bacterium]
METAVNTKKRILVVDDEQRILKFLGVMLKVSGYDVITATNGQEGLQMVQTQNPDCILLDIVMPVMDGLEMLQKLRTFCQAPVVIFSARGQTSERAIGLGANDFIAKPFKPEELVERITRVMAR